MLLSCDGAISEAQFLHGRDDASVGSTPSGMFFSMFRFTGGRPVQRTYRTSCLEAIVGAAIGADDTYLSQSSFGSFSRKTVHFKQTRAAWVDLDLYNIDKQVDSATIAQILQHARALGIPAPSAVISSGRGCYLKWYFHVPVAQQQLPVWQCLQATLTAAFLSLAADVKAKDASRVLRLLDTRNSKSGAIVRVVDGSGERYEFLDMCRAVEALRLDLLINATNPKNTVRVKKLGIKTSDLTKVISEMSQRGDVDSLNLFAELRRPIMLEKMSERSLNWSRFCDLRNLYEQRGGIPVGERDTAMFWMMNFLSHAKVIRAADWNSEVAELSKAFPEPSSFRPTEDGSMTTLFNRLQQDESGVKYKWKGREVSPLYRPSNRFLIQAFAVEPQEMARLVTIISADEKRIRVDEKNLGRSIRRQARNQWRQEVRRVFLLNEEQNQKTSLTDPVIKKREQAQLVVIRLTSLAKFLGVERTRLSRYWNGLKREVTTQPGSALAFQLNKAEDKNADAYDTHSESMQIVQELDDSSERVDLDTARAAKLATFFAIEAKQEQAKLSFERRKNSILESWANKKLSNLLSNPEITSKEDAMAQTGLPKKMALLQAARAAERGGTIGEQDKSGGRVAELGNVHLAAQASKNLQVTEFKTLPQIPSSLVDEGYGEFFGAGQNGDVMKPTPATSHSQAFTPLEPQVDLLKNQSVMQSPADRLRAKLRQANAPVRKTTPVFAPVGLVNETEKASVLPVTGFGVELARQVLVETSSVRICASERLQAVAERVSKLPPLQRESKSGAERVNLVEGGPGAPKGYPSVDAWPSDCIPPGSHYGPAEWEAAREGVDGQLYEVIELQSPDRSRLLQLCKPKQVLLQTVVNGMLVNSYEDQWPDSPENQKFSTGLNHCLRMLYSDCLLVTKDSFPDFPSATEADFTYDLLVCRVIRPRRDYLDETRAFRVGARTDMHGPEEGLSKKEFLHNFKSADENEYGESTPDTAAPSP